jgi:hypothetical protein
LFIGSLLSLNGSQNVTLVLGLHTLVPEAVVILKSMAKGPDADYILSSTGGSNPIRGIGKFFKTRLPREIVAHTGQVCAERNIGLAGAPGLVDVCFFRIGG